jgi:hypothetical protein
MECSWLSGRRVESLVILYDLWQEIREFGEFRAIQKTAT